MTINKNDLLKLHNELKEKNARWEAGHTSLHELTDEQRRMRLGYIPGPDDMEFEELEKVSASNYEDHKKVMAAAVLPSQIDWRNIQGRSFVTSIKDQGHCGSCVAFGTAAAVESSARIIASCPVNGTNGGVMPNLSEAQLFFCGAGAQGRTCGGSTGGWWISSAVDYVENTGLTPDSCFPYSGHDQPCNLCPVWKNVLTDAATHTRATSIQDMKQSLIDHGPLITRFTVYSDFYSYRGGVYHHVSGGLEGGHCVCCVGYNDDLQAWLCKNSWGSGWGMGGYFWIAYGQCGIDGYMYSINNFDSIYPLFMDVHMRDNQGDYGQVPCSGSLSHSPDIIPYGTTAVENPAEFFKANWYESPGKDLQANRENYIYLRGKSLKNGAQDAQFYLYFSKASLLLFPSQWKNNQIKTSDNKDYSEVSAQKQGDILVSPEPFAWKPEVISNDHYCLVGRVVTADNPNPIPDVFNVPDFAKYVANNPNIAWRNVKVVNNDAPDVNVDFFYNQGTTEETMHIIASCENVPVGAEIAINCGTPGPVPMINLPKTIITNPQTQDIGIVSTIPANFESNINFSYWKNGTTPTGDWKITISLIYIVDNENELYESALDPKDLGMADAVCDQIGPEKGIVLGSYVIEGKDLNK